MLRGCVVKSLYRKEAFASPIHQHADGPVNRQEAVTSVADRLDLFEQAAMTADGGGASHGAEVQQISFRERLISWRSLTGFLSLPKAVGGQSSFVGKDVVYVWREFEDCQP